MLEDKFLLWKLRHGSADALRQIYEKYRNDLLGLAIALSQNGTGAEDVVHDVFVSFARSSGNLRLRTNLKSYLSTSVANRVRSLARVKLTTPLDAVEVADPDANRPDRLAISKEQMQRIGSALADLPYEQREAIILRLQSGLKFKDIAVSQKVSVNTIQSRYRYGISKLQSLLNGEV
jgi:RNA polymerase sigma-70 factor (ECF subfamily)